MGDTLTARS